MIEGTKRSMNTDSVSFLEALFNTSVCRQVEDSRSVFAIFLTDLAFFFFFRFEELVVRVRDRWDNEDVSSAQSEHLESVERGGQGHVLGSLLQEGRNHLDGNGEGARFVALERAVAVEESH